MPSVPLETRHRPRSPRIAFADEAPGGSPIASPFPSPAATPAQSTTQIPSLPPAASPLAQLQDGVQAPTPLWPLTELLTTPDVSRSLSGLSDVPGKGSYPRFTGTTLLLVGRYNSC